MTQIDLSKYPMGAMLETVSGDMAFLIRKKLYMNDLGLNETTYILSHGGMELEHMRDGKPESRRPFFTPYTIEKLISPTEEEIKVWERIK